MASLLTGKMAQYEDKSEKTFSLDKANRTVKVTKTVEIPPFSTIQVHGTTKVKGHDKRVNLILEPKDNRYNPSAVVVPSYANLRPGSRKVNMSLRNLTNRNVTVRVKSIVAQVTTANVVPSTLTLKDLWNQKNRRTKEQNPLIWILKKN